MKPEIDELGFCTPPDFPTWTTERTGTAPVISSATGTCGTGTSSWSVTASDDGSVVSVEVRYNDSDGTPRTVFMVNAGGNAWRGTIDTADPRLVMTATATGANYVAANNQRRHAVQFLCAAVDRNLEESSLNCPGRGGAVPGASAAPP